MSRRVIRPLGRAAGALLLAGGALLVTAQPAAAELAEPAGACEATGTWRDGGFTVTSTAADPADVIEVPRADQVAWSGRVTGPQPGDPRPIAGAIELQLPAPLGRATIDSWDGTGVNVESSGTRAYDLPGLVPAGVVFTLRAEHREGDAVFCSGTAKLRIAGGPFDSPLIWVGLAGTAMFGGLLLLAGRAPAPSRRWVGRTLAGALLGGLFLGSGALTLLLFGVVGLASPLLTVAPVAGAVAGAGWGRWAPLGAARTVPVG